MLNRSLLAFAACTVLSSAAAAQSTVELLEAGASPRAPLRYSFESGRTERASLDTLLQISILLGGQQLPLGAMPPIKMVMQLRSSDVAADGSARIDFELVSSEANGEDLQAMQMNQALQATKGLTGWYRVDNRGRLSAGQLNLPEGSAAGQATGLQDIQQSMQQMAAPLPEESVGAGARWRVVQNVSTNDMKMRQTAEYTLRSRSGNRVELDVKLVDASMESLPTLPAEVKLDSLQMQGGGSTAIQLDRLVPSGTVDADIAMTMSMSAQGQSQNMAMNMKLKQAIAPAN